MQNIDKKEHIIYLHRVNVICDFFFFKYLEINRIPVILFSGEPVTSLQDFKDFP